MWVLKLKVKEEFNIYNKRSLQFKIKIQFFSRTYYSKGNKLFFINSGIISGKEKKKKQFFNDLKKDKKITNLEINGDFFISVYYEKKSAKRIQALKTVYNQKIIFIKPVIIDEEGFEEWEVASFDRKDLEEIIKQGKLLLKEKFILLNFKKKKIKNLMIQSITPNLTSQQQKALELAIKNNYYGYPKKITLKKLAKMMNISESTYQFHLAKAEAKIIPSLIQK